jgi:hypothetical protein
VARRSKSRPSQGTRSRTRIISAGTTKLAASAVAKLERAATATGTDGEQKLENNQTVPDAAKDKWLKSLVGAQGLEPWTR